MGNVLFQVTALGNVVKITAIDETTGVEVVVTGPRNTPPEALKRNALKKLQYVLAKKAGGGGTGAS